MNGTYLGVPLAASLLLLASTAGAQTTPKYDLRDIIVGMRIGDLPYSGYVNLTCARRTDLKLSDWSSWRDCPADDEARRAIRFEFDPETSRDGTLVAGHPVILTALIDAEGIVSELDIDTDPKARLYQRKKAFLLGMQVKSRYGSEGWDCAERQPTSSEQPVGGVFVRETCKKAIQGRRLTVQRDLYRRLDQDPKNFVDQTQVKITVSMN